VIADPTAPLLCGVDLPAGGGDKFVARFRRGLDARSIPPVSPRMPDGRPMKFREIVDVCEDILDRTYEGGVYVQMMYIDDSQYGRPLYEELCEHGYRGSVALVNFNGVCPDPDHYENMRAWMYCGAAEWGEAGGRIDENEDLKEDLSKQQLDKDAKKNRLIPKKDIIAALGGRSPDDGDAFALTFARRRRRRDRRRSRMRKLRRVERGEAPAGRDAWMH